MDDIKLVVVGDGQVGKTTMMAAFTTEDNLENVEFQPTIVENINKTIQVDGMDCCINAWDTAGQEEFARLRSLSYPGTDIFVVVFSIASHTSMENVSTSWVPEVQHFCPDASLVLVGNKLDMRQKNTEGSSKHQFVSTKRGLAKAKEIKAVSFVECSALTREGIEKVFTEAVRAVRKAREPSSENVKKRKCVIL